MFLHENGKVPFLFVIRKNVGRTVNGRNNNQIWFHLSATEVIQPSNVSITLRKSSFPNETRTELIEIYDKIKCIMSIFI